jgi:hypothetical protein
MKSGCVACMFVDEVAGTTIHREPCEGSREPHHGPCCFRNIHDQIAAGGTSFTFSPESRYALKNWAKRVSTNSRSPTEPSAPGIPIAATEAGQDYCCPLRIRQGEER